MNLRQLWAKVRSPSGLRDLRALVRRRPVWAIAPVPLLLVVLIAAYAAFSGAAEEAADSPGDGSVAESTLGPGLSEGRAFAVDVPDPAKEARVVYSGSRDVKAVALTFDTGVGPGYTEAILDLLAEKGAKGTFGITGEWAITNPRLLKRIVADGHGIINHSWGHPSFTGEDTETEPLTEDEMRDQLQRTEEKVQEIAGVSTKPYFRPPYGDYDKTVNEVVRQEGYEYNLLWTVDSMGWDGRSSKAIVSTIMRYAQNGAIYLFHTDNPRDAGAMEEVIDGLAERGFQMVTIPQLLGKEPLPTPVPGATPASDGEDAPTPVEPAAPGGGDGAPGAPLPAGPAPAPGPGVTPTPIVTVTPIPTATPVATPAPYDTLASDDFETGDGEGGTGWLDPWQAAALSVPDDTGHSGTHVLAMAQTGLASRTLALTAGGPAEARLQFWARFEALEAADEALVRIRQDTGAEKTYALVHTGTTAGGWYLFDIAFTLDAAATELTVEFETGMSGDDVWDVDDVSVLRASP